MHIIHAEVCIYWYSYTYMHIHVDVHCSVAQSCLTLGDPMDCSTPGSLSFSSSWSLLRLISIESMMPSNHLLLCCPLLLLSVFPSFGVFFSKSAFHIRWPEYWSFSFSVSPSNEYSCIYMYIHTNIHHIYTMRITGNTFYWVSRLLFSFCCLESTWPACHAPITSISNIITLFLLWLYSAPSLLNVH